MKLTEIDLEPEELCQLHSPDSPTVVLTTDDVRLSNETPITIKYDYLDLDITEYHFKQSFEWRDTKEYFDKMKTISSSTINDLQNVANELHFRRSPLKGNLRKALCKRFKGQRLDDSIIIYHFALYSDKDVMANREKNIRCPRIYFFQGTYGTIYPLFFDPFHELNP